MRRTFALCLLSAWMGIGDACAEEGLWTFDGLPLDRLRNTYGFAPDQAWLDQLRLASVRLSGCSAGIVSGRGLVQTNHHCVLDCIQALAEPGQDINMTPVLATSQEEERQCPGFEAEVVVDLSDVTARIVEATRGLSGEAFEQARNGAIATIEEECGAGYEAGYCEVIPLYSGGKYALHKYRTYDDVRLVLGPEIAAGSFGGDPDNFSFPRFAFDVAFLRLYDDGKPAETPKHFTWRSEPLTEGELLFISGSPGSTGRLWATSTISLLADTYFPYQLVLNAELRGRLIEYSSKGAEQARQASALLNDIENSYKSDRGEFSVLADPAFVGALRASEDALRARVAADPALAAEIGDPWAEIAKADANQRRLFFAYRLVEADAGGHSELLQVARMLVRVAEQRARPQAERKPGYSDPDIELMGKELSAENNIEAPIEEMTLAFWLSKTREFLTVDHPLSRLLLGRESPEELAHRLLAGTRLGSAAERKRLFEGGAEAIARSTDPLILFVKQFDRQAQALGDEYREAVRTPKDLALERIARAHFKVYGSMVYPDATGSLRLNFGKVDGWTEPDGRRIGSFTSFAGLYDRATGADPFKLTPLWEAARDRLDPATIFNVSTDNDTIGGNSGSPTIDRDGRIVGAMFDGNLHGFGGFYRFDQTLNRSVVIASTAIEEGLAKVYGLQRIVDELKEP